jgi:NADPH2:quinone reductase
MRAIVIDEFGGPDRLRATDLPRPKPARGELLIRVVAAGVNPVDWKIREGMLAGVLPHTFPLIPGWDAAGVVEELGEGATRFRKGDRVWCFARKPVVQWGCYAEYLAVNEGIVALMPTKLLYEEAAAVPAAAVTAFQCLLGNPGLERGDRVLVHAAAGGVGHFAVQLASDAGAEVWGTAGPANQAFVMELGAAGAIDYTKEDFVEAARRAAPDGFNRIIDGVGGDTLARSYELVKPGGSLVSIVEEPDAQQGLELGIEVGFLAVEPNAEQLGILAGLVDKKRLRAHVQKIFSLAQAAEAQTEVALGHVRGKLVLNL